MIKHPVIDSHLHIWDINKLDYPWLDNIPKINRNFLLSDYDEAKKDTQVEAMVFLQCNCKPEQHLEELSWVRSIADKDHRLKGIVPWAPVEAGEEISNELAFISSDKRVKGIRRIIQSEPDPDFCIKPHFVRGVQLLHSYGLHFELTIRPNQFKNVVKLVEACPDTPFILDHIGNPDILNSNFQPWYESLKHFAASGPHFCKFSNLVCNADLDNWTIEDLKPYADAVIEIFGADRIIWGSDWPNALRASTWSRWFETTDALLSQLSKGDRYKILHNNAITFYRLG